MITRNRLAFLRDRHRRHGKALRRNRASLRGLRNRRLGSLRDHLWRHALLRRHLLWVRRIAGLPLGLVSLLRVGLARWLLSGEWRAWILRWRRVSRLLWIAGAPSGSRGRARLSRLAGGWPRLRGGRRCPRVLAWLRRRLPRGHLAGACRSVPVRGRDRPLLIRRDIRSRGALEDGLAASQQIEKTRLVDVEVSRQGWVDAGCERELATLEFPEEIERLPGAPNAATARMRQRAPLKGVDPVPAWLVELQDAGLAAIDHLVEEAEQPNSIDGAERLGLCRGARFPFALGEELHTAVTGNGMPSLPV